MLYNERCRFESGDQGIVVRGRVVEVAPPTVVIMGQEGSTALIVKDCELPARGDIVEVLADNSRQPPQAISLHRLVVPAQDPLTKSDSMFHRLHRNQGRIQQLLLLKSRFLELIRSFFASHDFLEWQTPRLVASPGLEVHLQGFVTHYIDERGQSQRCYLPTSPEFSLKKALCAGMERIYEIGHCFRNGGETGPLHQCEFTMLEWYRAYSDYRAIMADVEELGAFLKVELHHANDPCIRGQRIDWSPPWPRTSLQEAFLRHCCIDLERGIEDLEYFQMAAYRLLDEDTGKDEDFDSLFFRVFLTFIEPHLGLEKPEIVYDYPIGMAMLAASKPGQPSFSERFELYVAGVELANGFTELNDPQVQEARFHSALKEKRRLGFPEVPIDGQFLRELGYGMPPAAGIALGLERLLMVLTGVEHIDDLFFLPHRWGSKDEQRLWLLNTEQ
jgi:lysyl-tRNA synthetase class 2